MRSCPAESIWRDPHPFSALDAILSSIVAIVLLVGCGPGVVEKSGEEMIQDTVMGGRREVHLGRLWANTWSRLEVASIDTLLSPSAEEPAIGRIDHVSLGEEGGLALVDGISQEVWRKTLDGWELVTRSGEGPAEVGFAGGLWWLADTLVVFDARRLRLLRFGPSGDPIGTGISLGSIGLPETRTASRTSLGGTSSEVFVVRSDFPNMVGDFGIQRPKRVLLRVALTPEALEPPDTLGIWPGRAWFLIEQGMGPLPFGPDTYLAFAGESVMVCDGEKMEAWRIDRRGLPSTRIVWEGAPESVGSRKTEFIEKGLSPLPPEGQARARGMLEAVPYPEMLPTVGRALAAGDEVWLAEWFGGEVESLQENWPRTEWRLIQLTSPLRAWGLSFPPGVMPVQPLPGLGALVILMDDLGRQGVGIANLEEDANG